MRLHCPDCGSVGPVGGCPDTDIPRLVASSIIPARPVLASPAMMR